MDADQDEHALTNEQYDELCKRFEYLAGSHCLAWNDLKPALELLNVHLAGHEFRELTGTPKQWVTMDEFSDLYARAREMKDNTKMIRKALLLRAVKDVKAFTSNKDSDVRHSVSKAEERGFTLWINKHLENDPDLVPGILPVDPNVDGQLYDRCKNGILLCKLINIASPNTIDERSINKGPALKHVFNVHENLTLAINSAAAIGCCVVNMGPDDIEKKKRHIVLGLIWQLIRKGLVDTITLTQHGELICLLQEGESPEDLLRLKPEEVLIRWVNYHMMRAGCGRRMTNYNQDVQDGEIYTYLLDQIAPVEKRGKMKSPAEILASLNDRERAANVLNNAEVLGARSFLSPEDIYLANESRDRLHLAFLATLFNLYPALDVQNDWKIEGETLEERTYRNWMNSLGVRPFVSFLDIDLSNGLILLQLIDIIQPGTVDWTQVVTNFDPMKRLFQEQGNCNLVVTSARSINIIFVNVSGEDIRERNKKLILGVVFQLMHAYTYKLLNEASGGSLMPRDDKEVLEWANEQLTAAKARTLKGFRDPAFATGVPILQLLEQIRPGSTNREVWLESTNDDFSLCTYAISCCRKAGARIYALPEHLRDLNGKMIQTILVSLQALDYSIRRRAEQSKKKMKKTKLTWLRVDDPEKSASDSE
ncbi:Lymphocyte cytosolic protein 1 [Paragonimus heterotremus]|uniref:Lymphocyte cytosolic protein 1 n=1 Tax=Paragonimus heterotremus TaxID=100268 RepID=A0A8J4SRB6_9TREM|nr:Lymphocyte cytosolic protein 1 [Paragonimus heterotremus]